VFSKVVPPELIVQDIFTVSCLRFLADLSDGTFITDFGILTEFGVINFESALKYWSYLD
tara:strand:+ start:383 stop:559 length:177 start_codon:yes stop_codon:yes gene_type:complete